MYSIRIFTGLALSAMAATGAAAQSAGCLAINGFSNANPSYGPTLVLTSDPLDAGDVIVVSGTNATDSWEFANGGQGSIPGSTVFPASGAFSETFVVPSGGLSALEIFDTDFTGPGSFTGFAVSCVAASVEGAANVGDGLITSASRIASQGQTAAIATGVATNIRNRFAGTGANDLSGSAFFFSTRNATTAARFPDYNVWASGAARHFSGGLDGYSADLVFGVDRLVSPTLLVGVLAAFGRTDLTQDMTDATVEVEAPAIGLYAARRFGGDLILDGALSYARPHYDLDDGSFTADRIGLAISLSGARDMDHVTLRPFLRIDGYSEDQPARSGPNGRVEGNDIDVVNASLGLRIESKAGFAGTDLAPFARVELDYGYIDATDVGSDDFLAPRLGVGLSGAVGPGVMTVDLDGGQVASDIYDIGLRLDFTIRF